MMVLKKIKAGALQLVTFITVVIALFLAGFILLMHTQKQYKVKSDLLIENLQYANTGILYALENPNVNTDTIILNIAKEDYKTLKIKTEYWGAFQKVYSTSKTKKNKFHKIALIGSKQPIERNALFLKENNKPLVLTGSTVIKGNVHLPKRGVKPGNIAGHSYYGKQLIYGNIKAIENFPRLDNQFLKYLNQLPEQHEFINGDQQFNVDRTKNLYNSFSNQPIFGISSTDIYLNDSELTGHIIIQSYSKITVDDISKLKDVILIAPIIEIKDGVKGRFQAFASKSIKVGRNCSLNYPSTLALTLTDNNSIEKEINSAITIDSNSKVEGSIIVLGKKNQKNYDAQLSIAETSFIKGEVYCELNIELKGKVYGTVYADTFISNTNGSKYQNHIFNAEIQVDALEVQYSGLPFFNAEKNIAKWLY